MTARDIVQERRGKAKTACYEIVDRRSRPMMLTVFLEDGGFTSIGYGHLYGVRKTAKGLNIHFSRHIVTVEGRNLGVIHEGLTDHRVTFLRASGSEKSGSENVVVSRIVVEDGRHSDTKSKE
ncbi:MAG: hypothetical protein KDN22_02975 [Verrucomicrobiae bacterium]|nr:hypothetical protein [Verrucomicrobiae bacterium]